MTFFPLLRFHLPAPGFALLLPPPRSFSSHYEAAGEARWAGGGGLESEACGERTWRKGEEEQGRNVESDLLGFRRPLFDDFGVSHHKRVLEMFVHSHEGDFFF